MSRWNIFIWWAKETLFNILLIHWSNKWQNQNIQSISIRWMGTSVMPLRKVFKILESMWKLVKSSKCNLRPKIEFKKVAKKPSCWKEVKSHLKIRRKSTFKIHSEPTSSIVSWPRKSTLVIQLGIHLTSNTPWIRFNLFTVSFRLNLLKITKEFSNFCGESEEFNTF